MSILAQISHKCLPQPGCRGHSTLWRWWWRRSRWIWTWWWSSRAGTAPPFFRSIWSLPHLALDLLQPLSWRWKAEPLLQVQLRPRRWFSSSFRCTWRSWPTTRSRWRPSATSMSSPTCSRKITSASLPHHRTTWKFNVLSLFKSQNQLEYPTYQKFKSTYAVAQKAATIRRIIFILSAVWPPPHWPSLRS